jgi:hypothetical protein
MHAKIVEWLANATVGLELAPGLTSKDAIEQVDRLLSNEVIDIGYCLALLRANVANEGTEFDADVQATLSLPTRHSGHRIGIANGEHIRPQERSNGCNEV